MNINNLVKVIKSGDYVVLDTETTGLDRTAEVVQIAVVNSAGTVLMDTLVRPVKPIPVAATRIHGITNEMVATAPCFGEIMLQLTKILAGRNVIVYNAVYDRKMLHQSAEATVIQKVEWKEVATWYCAMEAFAEIYGEWNSYRESYVWQKLSTAARYYSIPVQDAHSALGDCLATLAVCKAMAAHQS